MAQNHEEIGILLRTAREEFRLSLHDVSEALHIRAIYLEALEEGRFEQLPGAAYARGYLQSYAAYLQLDPKEILRRFEQQEARLRRGFYLPQGIARERRPGREAIWGGLAAAILVYLLWLAFQPHYGHFSIVDNPFKKRPLPENVACFHAQNPLYPPCHKVTEGRFTGWPMQGQVKSVMDLAVYQEEKN